MTDIVLINPKFEASYWGFEYAQKIFGKRANMPVACLPLLAALTPAEHQITLVDENVEPLDWNRLARADIVGLTGMGVQRFRMMEILRGLKEKGVFTVVGGPWATVQESDFDGLGDVVFVAEAEETWPRFLEDWKSGKHASRYEALDKPDMTKVPPPRLDLLKNDRYMFGSVQFSRGCPFQCEFCDIIVTFGRKVRIKTAEQVIQELEVLRTNGMQIAFIVDDNLIGNKKEIKPILAKMAAWQERNRYPLAFSCEASLDLCEDEELMELMARSNIQSVFIGIESPNEDSLRETKKYQNVRARGGTMLEKIHNIQDFGLEIWCGLIVGFDNDDPSIFDRQLRFIKASRIAHAMVGPLHAIPKTPLHDRLRDEGRLDLSGGAEYGTNVVPLGMTREQLRDGYIETMQAAYEPDAYFDRLEQLFLRDGFHYRVFETEYFKQHFWLRMKQHVMYFFGFLYMFARLMIWTDRFSLRREYAKRILRAMWARPTEPVVYFYLVVKCAMHYHHHKLAEDMAADPDQIVSSFGKLKTPAEELAVAS